MNKPRWLLAIVFGFFVLSLPFLVLKNERDFSNSEIAISAKKVTSKADVAQAAFNAIPDSLDPFYDLSVAIQIILIDEKDFPSKYAESNISKIRGIAERCVKFQKNFALKWMLEFYSLRMMSPDFGLGLACDGLSKLEARQVHEFDEHRKSKQMSDPDYLSDHISQYVVFLSFFDDGFDFP